MPETLEYERYQVSREAAGHRHRHVAWQLSRCVFRVVGIEDIDKIRVVTFARRRLPALRYAYYLVASREEGAPVYPRRMFSRVAPAVTRAALCR